MALRPHAARRSALPAPVLKAGAAVTEHELRNGLKVLLAERHGDPAVAVMLFYRVGARNETEREAGVSHLLEHLMFKGTAARRKGEVDRITTELGGQNNAFTGYDHTAYWFEFASDRWETALDLEADRMKNLLFDEDELEAERAVVLEELAMGEDDPWRVLGRRVEAVLFPRHPYGRPVIGFPDTLRALRPADVRDYYERFYQPGNATLVVCGDIRTERALRAVRRRFASIPRGPSYASADCFRPELEAPGGETRLSMTWDDQARRLVIGWPTARVGSDDDYALDLVLTVLVSGRISRLQRRLVHDEALATSIAASNDARVEAGAFWLYVEGAQGVAPEAIERALDDELERLARERVPAAELKRAKTLVRVAEAFDGETVSDLAEEMGSYAVDYDWRAAFDDAARHARVTAKEVQETAARLLARERRVVGWCLPAEAARTPARARADRADRADGERG